MRMLSLTFLVLIFVILLNICLCVNNNTLLLIISLDGFRYDYINRHITQTLNSFRISSSYPSYMQSIFPSKTFPNHFSIGTGLYSEIHGVLDNKFFDNLSNETLGYGFEMFHYNDAVVPIWTLNERAGGGRHSGCMMWPGSNFHYQGLLPSHYMLYNESVTFKERIDTLLSWFYHPEVPINLGLLYFQQPDAICHAHGPNSAEMNKIIAYVDSTLQYLLKELEETGLLSRLNIIILSDHGCQAVKVPENYINLTDFVDKSWYSASGVPPNMEIYPVNGKEIQVLKALKDAQENKGANFTTYARAEIPERWHYKNCRRTPPILVTADPGYIFLEGNSTPAISGPEIGTHGYDPSLLTMRAIFLAAGPMFKKGYEIEPFENINIYPLVAHMLGLNLPELKPNGSFSVLEHILVSKRATVLESHLTPYYIGGFIVVSLCAVIILALYINRKRLQRSINPNGLSTSHYKILSQVNEEERLIALESPDCEEDMST